MRRVPGTRREGPGARRVHAANNPDFGLPGVRKSPAVRPLLMVEDAAGRDLPARAAEQLSVSARMECVRCVTFRCATATSRSYMGSFVMV